MLLFRKNNFITKSSFCSEILTHAIARINSSNCKTSFFLGYYIEKTMIFYSVTSNQDYVFEKSYICKRRRCFWPWTTLCFLNSPSWIFIIIDTCSIVPVGPWSREGQRPLRGRSLGIGPGVRRSRTHQKSPDAQLKENCGGFFYFLFWKTPINSTNGWACLDIIHDTWIIYSLFLTENVLWNF